jgi:hypothetical protein
MYRQDTACPTATTLHEYAGYRWPVRTEWKGATVSESGNIKIDSMVGRRDESFVLVYFSGKFRSAIEDDVALLLPEPLLLAVE